MSTHNSKLGVREDLGQFFRSSWEANVARYYRLKGIAYEYEPKTFHFIGVKNGSVSYKPDFYLPETDEYIEVKGRMTSRDRTKLKRMAKFHPDVKVSVLGKDEYIALEKGYASQIQNWEYRAKKERNMVSDKIKKTIKTLEAQDFMVGRLSDEDDDFHIIATDGTITHVIQVVYQDSLEYELEDDFPVSTDKVIFQVLVYTKGRSNPIPYANYKPKEEEEHE